MTVLILTTSEDSTSDYLLARLNEDGTHAIRFDSDLFPRAASASLHIGGSRNTIVFDTGSQSFSADDVNCVIFRRRARPVPSNDLRAADAQFAFRESLFFLEGLFSCIPDRLWINAYWPTIRAERKPLQLYMARQAGLTIPDTLVTVNFEDAAMFLKNNPATISKSLSYGIIPGEPPQAIYTNRLEKGEKDLDRVAVCPTLFQVEVPKAYDLRVTWLDGMYVAMRIYSNSNGSGQALDWRRLDVESSYEKVPLADGLVKKISSLMSYLGLRYGALDFAVDLEGVFYFLEVNPAGEWGWLDRHCDGNISEMYQHATRQSPT